MPPPRHSPIPCSPGPFAAECALPPRSFLAHEALFLRLVFAFLLKSVLPPFAGACLVSSAYIATARLPHPYLRSSAPPLSHSATELLARCPLALARYASTLLPVFRFFGGLARYLHLAPTVCIAAVRLQRLLLLSPFVWPCLSATSVPPRFPPSTAILPWWQPAGAIIQLGLCSPHPPHWSILFSSRGRLSPVSSRCPLFCCAGPGLTGFCLRTFSGHSFGCSISPPFSRPFSHRRLPLLCSRPAGCTTRGVRAAVSPHLLAWRRRGSTDLALSRACARRHAITPRLPGSVSWRACSRRDFSLCTMLLADFHLARNGRHHPYILLCRCRRLSLWSIPHCSPGAAPVPPPRPHFTHYCRALGAPVPVMSL